MTTHPLWRAFEIPTAEYLAAARVGQRTSRPVAVMPPDPSWVGQFDEVRAAVAAALGERAWTITHVGSTSIPRLWAKPIIDLDLIVADSADEASYLPDLRRCGFRLTAREPDWEEHRCLSYSEPNSNLHVFSPTAVEPRRHLVFRDWLSTHPDDHEAYAVIKRGLAERGFDDVARYNDGKAALIYDIYERVFAADPDHPHDPEPRSWGGDQR